MDWAWLVEFKVPAWELILRGSVMYWLLFLFFRVVLRRDVGAVGVADVLLVVLIADASQNAMTGGYDIGRRRRGAGGDADRLEPGDRLDGVPLPLGVSPGRAAAAAVDPARPGPAQEPARPR